MRKLYWTADSPYCRLVLWAWIEAEFGPVDLIHLDWQQLRDHQCAYILGPELTVPCFIAGDSPLTDSLRILALLSSETFTAWLCSADGALYRCAEGQLGRIMYSLYEVGSTDKTHEQWKRALSAVDKLLLEVNKDELTWGVMAAQTFVNFCISLKNDLKDDLSPNIRRKLIHAERSPSFQKMTEHIQAQTHLIRCGVFSGIAGG